MNASSLRIAATVGVEALRATLFDEARAEARAYGRWLAALATLNVLILWVLPYLPGQDLPQHLAYARIWAEYAHDPFFQQNFAPLKHIQPYAVLYVALAALARVMPLAVALRLALSAYVIGLFVAFHVLCASFAGERLGQFRAQWPALAASFVVWSPVFCMGLLPFVLCIPPFLLGCAFVLRWELFRSRRDLALLAATAMLLSSVHLAAAGALALFVELHALVQRSRRGGIAAAVVGAAVAATCFAWSQFAELGFGEPALHLDVREAIRGAQGLDFVNQLLHLTWHDPLVILNYVVWTVFGPYGWWSIAAIAAASIVGIAVLRSCRPQRWLVASAARRTAIAFAVTSCLAPWALYVPTEVTFINLRLMSLGMALLLAALAPALFATKRARRVLVVGSLLAAAMFLAHAVAFNLEATRVARLWRRAAPRKVMLSLDVGNSSASFAPLFRVTHFLPLYYLVEEGGIPTQFWGRYVPHLPIDYRPGRRPPQPPDWFPWQVDPRQIDAADYVAVGRAADDASHERQSASAYVEKVTTQHATVIDCAGSWCLYVVDHSSVSR